MFVQVPPVWALLRGDDSGDAVGETVVDDGLELGFCIQKLFLLTLLVLLHNGVCHVLPCFFGTSHLGVDDPRIIVNFAILRFPKCNLRDSIGTTSE